jgi:spermidine/putrescine transport system substrate-binding protein
VNSLLRTAGAAVALVLGAGVALADGELNIFNWGDYISADMVKKFEEQYSIKVTVTDYDSNDTALAKVRQGGHGFDVVMPSSNFIPIWISEGLVLETRPDQMENFKNMDPKWIDVPFDPGRHYTVPWQWGTTGVVADTSVYKGDVDTSAIVFDPPEELKGKINVVPEMGDVMALAIMYMGGEPCTGDKELLKKVRGKLVEAKKNWVSLDYATIEKFGKRDLAAGLDWNGNMFRARLQNADIKYGYPKEGFVIWMDNVVVLKDAKNVENAKLFQNFLMTPEAAGMNSSFNRYANGILGSEAFMPDDMKSAREIVIPPEILAKGKFITTCAPDVTEIYTSIWTEVMK